MSLLGTFLHASPYLAQALEQHRQRKRQAVLDHLAQRRAEADIAHLRTQDEIARQTAARIPVRYQVDEQGNLVAVPTQLSPDQLVGSSGSSTGAVPEPATSRAGPIPVADLFGLRPRPALELLTGVPRRQPASPLGPAGSTAPPPALQAPSLADAVKRPAGPRPLTDFLPVRPAAPGSSSAAAAGSVPVYRTGIKGPKARIDPNSSEGIKAAAQRAAAVQGATGEPLVPVMRDGKRVYVPRSQAAGQEAPAPSEMLVRVQDPNNPQGPGILMPRSQASGQHAPQTSTLASTLRRQFASDQTVRDAQQVVTAYQKIKNAATGPHTPTNDMSLVYGIMKMQDPGSTVREGEYASAENAASVPARIRDLYNLTLKKHLLPDDTRQDFLETAELIARAQRSVFAKTLERYTGVATRQGLDPLDVVYDPYAGIVDTSSTAAESPTPEQALWDAAVQKYGRERVLQEYGPRPNGGGQR